MLVDAGIKAGVGIAPVLPGLSDDPAKLEAVVKAARDAGATFAWANVLHLKPGTREHFLAELGKQWPELAARYQALYQNRAYLAKAETEPVITHVRELKQRLRHRGPKARATRAAARAGADPPAGLVAPRGSSSRPWDDWLLDLSAPGREPALLAVLPHRDAASSAHSPRRARLAKEKRNHGAPTPVRAMLLALAMACAAPETSRGQDSTGTLEARTRELLTPVLTGQSCA